MIFDFFGKNKSASNKNLEQILNQAPLGMCVINKDQTLYIDNPKFLELIAQNDRPKQNSDVLNILYNNILGIKEYIDKGFTGDAFEVNLTSIPRPGEKILWFNFIGTPIFAEEKKTIDKLLLFVSDITQRKEMELGFAEFNQKRNDDLAREKAKFEASINSINVGFIITDTKCEIVTVNSAAKKIFCLPNAALAQSKFSEFALLKIQCNMSDIVSQLHGVFDLPTQIQKCLQTGRYFDIGELPFKNWFLHIFISPIAVLKKSEKVGIEIIGTVILIEDITKEKILEHSRADFFSIASHELRTPLTAIKINSEVIMKYYFDTLKDDKLKTMIDDIHKSCVSLIDIVNDFLDVSRLEQGKIHFSMEKFDPIPTVLEIIQELQPVAEEKHLYLKFNKPVDLGEIYVRADQSKFKQVLINLIGNALKFTQNGGVEIISNTEGRFLKVTVVDTGSGIAPHNQNLIFKKFQLASDNILTRETSRNTGVGLYISKMMVEGMRGQIQLEKSEIGKGCIFSFTIPLELSSTEQYRNMIY